MDYNVQRLENGQHLDEKLYNGLIDNVRGRLGFKSDEFCRTQADYPLDKEHFSDFFITTKEKLHFTTCGLVNGSDVEYSIPRLLTSSAQRGQTPVPTLTPQFMKKNGDIIDPSKIEIVSTGIFNTNIFFRYKKEANEVWNETEIIVHDFEYEYYLQYVMIRNTDGTIIRIRERNASM